MLLKGNSTIIMDTKNFDEWDKYKKILQTRRVNFYCKKREVWWCSLGINIGSEQDGKNQRFERPVLVITVFNKDMVRVAPITTRKVDDINHAPIFIFGKLQSVIVSQVMTLSTKRLHGKPVRIEKDQFDPIVLKLIDNIK